MSKSLSLAIILTLAALTAFANIGGLDVYALDEAKNAEAARAMYVSGDYVVPMYNGELRTDKPPLHYYFMVAGYSIFGINPVGAIDADGLLNNFSSQGPNANGITKPDVE